jgi:hypothetical protein
MGDGMVEERAVLELLAPPAWLELLLAMGRKSEGTTRVGGALMGALLLRPVCSALRAQARSGSEEEEVSRGDEN